MWQVLWTVFLSFFNFTFQHVSYIICNVLLLRRLSFMSTFSDLFSLFIKSREINVSALTAYCNLDRSTMYKLINGKRTPTSKELVRQIASFMNLNPVETQELVDAYLLTKVGWEAYYRRKNVMDFILNFDELRLDSAFPASSSQKFRPSAKSMESSSVPLTSQLHLSAALQQMLLESTSLGSDSIRIFAQPEHLQTLNVANFLANYQAHIKIEHILCINNNKSLIRSQRNYNIQCLKRMVPLYGTLHDYQPYFYYDNVNSHFNNLNILPCMFIAGTSAILCSSDLKEGILFSNKDIVELLKNRFDEMLKETSPLTQEFSTGLNFHLKNFSSIYSSSQEVYSLSAEACLIPFFTPDLVDKYMRKDFPDRSDMIADLNNYIKAFSSSNLHIYFSKDGILNFLMTGYIREIPDSIYTPPVDMADRLRLLRKLSEHINGKWDIRMMKGPMDKFPLPLHLSITSNYGYMMFSRCNKELVYIMLKEQNILNSFYDFACSLEENEMLCTYEETAAFLRSVVEQNTLRASSLS